MESILEDSTGMTLDDLSSDVEDAISDELAPLAASLDDAINGEIDSGYTVQSVEIDSGELVIEATKPTMLTPKPRPWP